jgi:hypothetical protein
MAGKELTDYREWLDHLKEKQNRARLRMASIGMMTETCRIQANLFIKNLSKIESELQKLKG